MAKWPKRLVICWPFRGEQHSVGSLSRSGARWMFESRWPRGDLVLGAHFQQILHSPVEFPGGREPHFIVDAT